MKTDHIKAPMSFSDAVLKGCEIAPNQCFGDWADTEDSACVVAAALIGVYGSIDAAEEVADKCEDPGLGLMNLAKSLWGDQFIDDRLDENDTEELTREEIAERLR